LLAVFGGIAPLAATSPWVQGYNSRTRLDAGSYSDPGGAKRLIAGVEIEIANGWKTYWRAPGDSGGVPPNFNWSGSTNLAAATVLYPAPKRMADANGESIGYKTSVVFPIEVTPRDPQQPVTLELAFEYGICREICVPAEAKMSVVVPPVKEAPAIADAVKAALESVPRPAALRRPGDPHLVAGKAMLTGDAPALVFDTVFPGGVNGADLFVEAPDGIYVPLPKQVGQGADGRVSFRVDLTQGAEPEELKGKLLTLTLVGATGASVATFKID
jgi:DsbC/DsbD-like thiol-disulfide interchange protein